MSPNNLGQLVGTSHGIRRQTQNAPRQYAYMHQVPADQYLQNGRVVTANGEESQLNMRHQQAIRQHVGMNQIDLGGVIIDSYPVRHSEFSEKESIENDD